jgi:DNA-binding SARP family transcriptional activator
VEISVLGSLMVCCGETSVTPTAGKPRTVLAMFAMHPNQPVPVDSLIAELWDKCPPSSARTTVQTYVMQLRRIIERAIVDQPVDHSRQARNNIVTVPGGYMMTTRLDESVDLWRFNELAAAGHRSREQGDFESAAAQFREALECWRGPALLDVQAGPHLSVDIEQLDEARLNVLDCRIEADLRLGRNHELLGELAALAKQYRAHEGLAAHLILALCRSGRRSEALEAYQKLKVCLAEEHGLDPSPQLRRLQHAIQTGDQDARQALDNWNAATDDRRSGPVPAARRPQARIGRIPAELASISWREHRVSE